MKVGSASNKEGRISIGKLGLVLALSTLAVKQTLYYSFPPPAPTLSVLDPKTKFQVLTTESKITIPYAMAGGRGDAWNWR